MSSVAAKSSSKIQRITEAKCREWAANPTLNPITGKNIDIDGPTYNALKERCLNKYNIALPSAVVALDPGAAAGPAASSSKSSSVSSASSASVETKNKTAGWKRPVPKTPAAAFAIIDLIGSQIWSGIKILVRAQNKDPVDGLKNINITKLFKNFPYYRPYINSINTDEIFENTTEVMRLVRIGSRLINLAIHQYRGGYSLERMLRLIDPTAPKVIVMLHKVFTFLHSLEGQYGFNREIHNMLVALQPHYAEAQRQVDNLNLAILLRRARNATNTLGADALTRDIAGLLLTRRPGAPAVPAPAPPAQGGRKTRKLKK